MTHDPINPKSRNPAGPRLPENRLEVNDPIAGDPIRDPYHRTNSRFSSPSQILVGLVLVIAVVVGLGLLFARDSTTVPLTTEIQPQAQPEQSSQAPAPAAPAEGTSSTSTN